MKGGSPASMKALNPRGNRSRRQPARGRPPADIRGPDETRDRLHEAALTLFAERGYQGASIKAIADRAGVTGGTIYCHYRNKGELLLRVLQAETRETFVLERELQELDADALTLLDLARMISRYATGRLHRARRLTLELHAAAAQDPLLGELHLEWNRACQTDLRGFLERCREHGLVDPRLDVRHTADLLLTMILGLAHLETLDPDLIDDRSWVEYLESAVLTVLSGRTEDAPEKVKKDGTDSATRSRSRSRRPGAHAQLLR
jgi:AcrR family transcriptional regulator